MITRVRVISLDGGNICRHFYSTLFIWQLTLTSLDIIPHMVRVACAGDDAGNGRVSDNKLQEELTPTSDPVI